MNDPNLHPPQWPLSLLRRFCPGKLYEEIEGDLLQRFFRDTTEHGAKSARRKFVRNAVWFFRPGIILRNKISPGAGQLPMFRNYFKTAFRYFANHKIFSGINIFGLATGMCVSFLALLYVHFELSYDTYHQNADKVYRLVTDVVTSTGVNYQSTSVPMAPAIQAAFPEVRSATRILLDYMIVEKDNESFGEEHIAYADPSLHSIFTLPLISGNPATALNNPFTIVLSESAARKYFGTTDCLGKTLLFDRKYPSTVTGVMKDMPLNSHFRTDIFLSLSTLIEKWNPSLEHNWTRFICYTYLLVDQNYNTTELSDQITTFVRQHTNQQSARYNLSLEPLKRIYLHSNPRGSRTGSADSGNLNNIYIIGLTAFLVLFIACFNFINLTTAFSMHRAKEISVRKVFGAARLQLIIQFLTDAVTLSLIAFVLALVMCASLIPSFDALAGKAIATSITDHTQYIGLMFLGALLIGLLSGIYPAFFLSGFQLAGNLKGRFSAGLKGTALRKSLVVAQFSVAIILVIATLVIYRQLDYMQNTSLGFKKDHMLAVDFYFDSRISHYGELIKNELTQLPGIEYASLSSSVPGKPNRKLATLIENADHQMLELFVDAQFADDAFLEQYEVEVVAGRAFSDRFATDSTEAMMINEATVKGLGYNDPKDALGKRFTQLGQEGTIVGVVKDFHFQSLREEVQPLTLRMTQGYTTFLTLTVSSQDLSNTINNLRQKWKELLPDTPFIYFFTDEAFHAQYMNDERFGKLAAWFATIAILISCLGLLGLSAFSAVQRTREIGIRKVLGASVSRIVSLLTKDFMLLVVIAFGIGAPIAWLGMRQWLQGFAYRIDVPWWTFALTGFGVVLAAFITISFQAIRAAFVNPVDSLKIE